MPAEAGQFILCMTLIFLFPLPGSAEVTLRHEISAKVDPDKRAISVTDTITMPEEFDGQPRFVLHRGMKPSSPTAGLKLIKEKTGDFEETYLVILPRGMKTFTLIYGGEIYHPIRPIGRETARGFDSSPGIISGEGVVLSGSSLWVPVFGGAFMSFVLDVELPGDWDCVSQGERTLHQKEARATRARWESPEPQDEAYLICARFTEYTKQAGRTLAMAFLRKPDKGLAERYLDATVRYLAMYEGLVGPYPYGKFALVENFWETGFGMPSFTLLGPAIIRLPFIINSSYPHEILHNWWGNSVFPEYEKGNWAEGLTAYLSDHLIREQQGGGAEYRLTTLQKYADYVMGARDFPLTEFRSRHSASTEAVGYGKSLMLFHMLRLRLGDEVFRKSLGDFYRDYRFRSASFNQLRESFGKSSGKDLTGEFRQWVEWTGAPELRLAGVGARKAGGGFVLSGVISQVQKGDAYRLRIPLAVTMEGVKAAFQSIVEMSRREARFEVRLPARPVRIDIDPEFDVFRRLDRDETPPAISQALGSRQMLIILPSAAGEGAIRAWREFSLALRNAGPEEVEVRTDREVERIPSDRTVAVLGWENRFLKDIIPSLSAYEASWDDAEVRLEGTKFPRGKHSVVVSSRNPANRDVAFLFIASSEAEALPGLGRKLPHYHKYSYLGFSGTEAENIAKGRWPVIGSPMTAYLPGADGKTARTGMAELAKREPLADLPQVFSLENMEESVRSLADESLEGRSSGSAGAEKAARFIAGRFREAGLAPGGDGGSYFQTWEDRELKGVLRNVIGIVAGKNPGLGRQSVVIGAHYDHLGTEGRGVRDEYRGRVHPGADDNASGVAVLMEIARIFGRLKPERTIVFVAFDAEEAGRKGSKHYVGHFSPYPAAEAIAMLNLDTVGRLGRNKLLVLGGGSAREWAHIFRGASYVTGVELETVPEMLDSSDQMSFQEAGVPAVQLFSGAHKDYHRPSDTFEGVDAEGLAKAALVAREAVDYLANRQDPLTSLLKPQKNASAPQRERKTGIGTIPDFSFSGTGCRLAGVLPGSSAEACGLREGDVILAIGGKEIRGLKDLSEFFKAVSPGTRVTISFLRDGKEMTAEAEITAR